MSWFHFRLHQALSKPLAEELIALSGPRVLDYNKRISAGLNCAWMVQRWLVERRIPVRAVDGPTAPLAKLDAIPELPLMRERVSGLEPPWPHYLMPWQQGVITGYGHAPSVRLEWPCGAGKTLGAIVWSVLHPAPTLVITRSGARRTFAADIKRFTRTEAFILEGQKERTLPANQPFVVTGWDTLPHHGQALAEYGFGTIIFDEIHRAKGFKRFDAVPERDAEGNPVFDETGKQRLAFHEKTNVAAAAQRVSESPSIVRRMGLTATPIPDRLRDIWGQLHLLDPDQWSRSPYRFFARYCNGHVDVHNRYVSTGKAPQPLIDELNARLAFSLYKVHYAQTHRDLPPKRRQVTYFSRDDLLRDEGPEARAALKAAAHGGQTAQASAKLAAAAARKRSAVVDLVTADQSGGKQKFVVLTGLRGEARKLADALRKKLPGVQIWCGTGDDTVNQRDRIREDYMGAPGPCGIVGTLEAWGESLNLQDTDVAYIVMLPMSPGKVVQVEGRFSRRGQTRPCLIHYLAAEGTYDEHVVSLLLDKLPAVENVAPDEELMGFGQAIAGLDNPEAVEAALLAKLLAGPEDNAE